VARPSVLLFPPIVDDARLRTMVRGDNTEGQLMHNNHYPFTPASIEFRYLLDQVRFAFSLRNHFVPLI
jgi:hypothetical protein